MSKRLSISIFGNTNNYPLLLAEGLRELGHRVHLIVNRKDALHRPESKYPEWRTAYPPWISDFSHLTDDDVAYMTPAVDQVVHEMARGVDLAILNDYGPALAEHLSTPYVAMLTGSDLTHYANFDSLGTRTRMWAPEFKRSVAGRRHLRRMTDLVGRQRDGILGAQVVCYGQRGLIPEGDHLLDTIGVTDKYRLMLHIADIRGLSALPPPPPGRLRILCGSRIVFGTGQHADLGAIDFKGTDVLINGFAQYCAYGGNGELRLPKKGPDLDAAQRLITDLDIEDRITWLPEMPLNEFYREMASAHLVCDQFGTSFPGMVSLDAMAMGRPVMSKMRNDIFQSIHDTPLPGFDVSTPQEIAASLVQAERTPKSLSQLGASSRIFAETQLSPQRMASKLLQRCKGHQA